VRCPHCKNKVIQKVGDVTRIRTGGPVEIAADGRCTTLCHWCRAPIEIPLQVKQDTLVPAERYVIAGKA
jgi:uncharacterized protein YodC (DUF2158 family)